MDLIQNSFLNQSEELSQLSEVSTVSPSPNLDDNNSFCSFNETARINRSLSYPGTSTISSSSSDIIMPNIFVQIPMQKNQPYQTTSSQNSKEIKAEPIKSEITELNGINSGATSRKSQSPCSITATRLVTARPKSTLFCYKCKLCPFISISQLGLNNHINNVHKNNMSPNISKKLSCPGCSNVFYAKQSMEAHLINDHQVAKDEIEVLLESLCGSTGTDSAPIKSSQSLVNVTKSTKFNPNRNRIFIKNVDVLRNRTEAFTDNNVINLIEDNRDTSTGRSNSNMNKLFLKNVNNLRNPDLGEMEISNQIMNEVPEQIETTNLLHQHNQFSSTPELQISSPDIVETVINSQSTNYLCNNMTISHNEGYFGNDCLNQDIGHQQTSTINRSDLLVTTPTILTNHSPVRNKTSIVGDHQINNLQVRSKIYIKNVNILKKPTNHQEGNNSGNVNSNAFLHLRTVDELNLMNLEDVQNLTRQPNNLQLSAENSKNSNDEVVILDEYNIIPDLIYNDDTEEILNRNSTSTLQDIIVNYNINENSGCEKINQNEQENYKNYYTVNLDGPSPANNDQHLNNFVILENMIENVPTSFNNNGSIYGPKSNSFSNSAINLQQNDYNQQFNYIYPSTLNPVVDLNKVNANGEENCCPVETVLMEKQQQNNIICLQDETDDDIFICAEEIINSNNGNINPSPTMTASTLTSTVTTGDNLTTHNSDENNESKAKGRIYVVNHLLESNRESLDDNSLKTNSASNNSGGKPQKPLLAGKRKKKIKNIRGRPKGSRQSGITEMRKLYLNLTPNEIGHKCDDSSNCAIRFRSENNLNYHKKCHTNEKYGIKCPECESDEFRNWNTLHTHLWRQHQIDMELYSCDICNFKTPVLSRLKNTHIKIHSDERNFHCEICNKAFKNTKQLKNHRRIHRQAQIADNAVIRKCEKCSAAFSNKKLYKEHVENEHCPLKTDDEYKCLICGKKANSKAALKTHALKHLNEQKFNCEKCNYTANDHNAFRRHKMIHNKEKRYKCSYCKYTSIQSTSYRNHLLKAHPKEANDIIFRCKDCSFETINKLKYKVHQVKHNYPDNKLSEGSVDITNTQITDDQETNKNNDILLDDDISQSLNNNENIIEEVVLIDEHIDEPFLTDDNLLDQQTNQNENDNEILNFDTTVPIVNLLESATCNDPLNVITTSCVKPQTQNKIKVKSNLVLTDPSKFITVSNLFNEPNNIVFNNGPKSPLIRPAIFVKNFSRINNGNFNFEKPKILKLTDKIETNKNHQMQCLNIDLT